MTKFSTWVLLFFLCLSLSNFQLKALSKKKSLTPVQHTFSKMSHDEKRILFKTWMNQSSHVILPDKVLKDATQYALDNGIDAKIFTKYKILFQIIFNDTLSIKDKISACEFILQNYEASMIPLFIVEDQKQALLQTRTKI